MGHSWKLEVDSYGFVLGILYSLITVLCTFQISRILYYRHAVLHYQFVFLLYSLLWGILRSIFWMFLPWESMQELVLQGSALLIQFLTFTFLVLFYAQMIYKSTSEWNRMKRRAVAIYGLINLLFTAAFVATIAVAVFTQFKVDSDTIQNAHAFFVAAMYLFLAGCLAVFGWRLMYLVSVDNVKIPFLRSKLQISILTVTLCFVFASRAVKDLLSGLGIGSFDLSVDPEMQPMTTQAILFSVYLFWEIIPATLVLVFFWHIPGTNKGPIQPVPVPYHSAFSINTDSESQAFLDSPSIASKVKATNQLFNTPKRFNSGDDELISPLRSPVKPGTPTTAMTRPHKPHFRQHSAYNTRSPLLDKSDQMQGSSPFGTADDV